MAKIYILEKTEPQRSFQTQNGTSVSQRCVFRDLDGEGQYAKRYAAEYLGANDLSCHQGKLVAANLRESFRQTEKGAFGGLIFSELRIIAEMF